MPTRIPLLALLLVLAACAGQTEVGKPPAGNDQAVVWNDRGLPAAEAGAALEAGEIEAGKPAGEAGPGPKLEAGTPPPVDQGAPPSSGLGALCTGTCAGADELCVMMNANASKGICLRKCTAPNTPCVVPDPKFFSPCLTYTSSSLPGPTNVCAIACLFQGKQYPCPNAVDYTCKSYGSLGVCVPK